ncbi:MAG: hypothetical protein ACKVVT_00235 [Dehalococcoidia bacterium]
MTNLKRMLAGSGLAAVLGAIVLGFTGSFGAHEAQAESPPNPPARFAGSVKVDGAAPPAGTRIEARIVSATCGVTVTFNTGAESRYVLDVPALDPGSSPNCGTDGAVVTFFIGDKQAKETGSWKNFDLNPVNLTYTTPPTATATASPSATPTSGGGGGGGGATPRPPATGNGLDSGSGSNAVLFGLIGLGVLAFAAGGAVAARRSR